MNAKHDSHKKHTTHAKANKDSKDTAAGDNRSLLYVFIGIGIILIIFGAVFVMSKYVFKDENTVEYNHYVFEKFEGNKWMTQQMIGGQVYNIPFYNNPEMVLDVPVDPNAVKQLRTFRQYFPNGTVYITVDPDESSKVVLAGVEYARILGTAYNIYNMNVKSAISEPVEGMDYQVVTCKNSSRNVFVIYQTVTDKNLVSLDGNCIILESISANESIRVADAFTFRLLNIIRDEQQNSTTSK
ncbi:MAG: hypothetical protein ACP5NW_02800 [Candidatus Woesearchaeota archaeon]